MGVWRGSAAAVAAFLLCRHEPDCRGYCRAGYFYRAGIPCLFLSAGEKNIGTYKLPRHLFFPWQKQQAYPALARFTRARAESIPSGKGGSAYYLAIHDRLDHEYWIYIGLPQAKQRSEEIAAIINAVLAEKPLPNIMPAVADKPARRTMYGLFWLNAVFTLLIMCLFFLMNGKAFPETTRHFFAIFFMALLLVSLCTHLICILFADEG